MVDHSRQEQHPSSEENKNEGFFKKPLSGSLQRLKDRVEHEVTEKTPSRAIRDDIGGSVEPTDAEWRNLESKVDQERAKRSGR